MATWFPSLTDQESLSDSIGNWPSQALPVNFFENLDNEEVDDEVCRTSSSKSFDPVVGSTRSGSTGFFDVFETSPTPEPADGLRKPDSPKFVYDDNDLCSAFASQMSVKNNLQVMCNLASLLELQQQQQQQQQHHQLQPIYHDPFDTYDLQAQGAAINHKVSSNVMMKANPDPSAMQIRYKFGNLGYATGQFNSPHGFCLGNNEEILIADTNNHRIQMFDKECNFRFCFGNPGKEEGFLWYPRKIAVLKTSGNIVVCDRGNERSRMQIFSPQGHFIRRIHIRFIDIVAALAISREGNILAVDSVTPTVFVLSESGTLLRYFDCSEFMSEPSDIAIFGNEYYLCDFKGHRVVVINEDGQFMRSIGSEAVTQFPNGIDISDMGDVLIGDSHGNQFHVAIFSRNGDYVSQYQCPQVKVSRCCGLKLTSEGYVVTLAKNNHHVLVLNTLYVR